MSASPARKFRSRTTEFLRGSSTMQSQVQGADQSDHEQSRAVDSDTDPSPKKRGSRIPFIGRSRKKSMPSSSVGQDVQEGRLSTATTRSRSLLNEQASVLPVQSRASTSSPSLPSSAQSTFGAKFAAHFTSSKTRGLLSKSKSTKAHAKAAGTETDYASDTRSPIRPSTDSRRSRRRSRSVTPRPSQTQPVSQSPVQPTITVSSPTDPYSLDEFEGLFTKPRHQIKPNPLTISRENPASPYHSDDAHLSSPTNDRHPAQPSGSPTSDSYPDLPGPKSVVSGGSASRRSSAASAASASSVGSAARQPRMSVRRPVYAHETERDLDSAEESEAVSMLSVKSVPIAPSMRSRQSSSSSTTITSISKEKRRSLTTLTSRLTPSTADKRRAPAVSLGSSQRPSIPLPSPPLVPPPQRPLPDLPMEPYRRTRAHTISSSLSGSSHAPSVPASSAGPTAGSSLRRHNTTLLSSAPIIRPPSQSSPDESPSGRNSGSSSSSSSTPTLTKSSSITPSPTLSADSSVLFPSTPITDSEIDKASVTELRNALRKRDTQINDITSYIRKQSEYYETERKELEARVLSAENEKKVMQAKLTGLEKEAVRRDKEIKGLTWLVMNDRQSLGPAINDPAAAIRSIRLSARSAAGIGNGATLMSRSSSTSISTSLTGGTSDDSSVRSSVTSATTPSSSSVKLPIYRKIQIGMETPTDSGAESSKGYLTSTSGDGEAEIASAPESTGLSQFSSFTSSGSGLKPKRTMRRLKLVESVNSRTFGFNSSVPLPSPSNNSDASSVQIPISIPDDVPYLLKPNKRASSSASSNSSPSPPMSPEPELADFPTASTSKGSQSPVLTSIPERPPASSSGPNGADTSERTRKPSSTKITFPFSSSSSASNPRTSSSSNSTSSSLGSSSSLPRLQTKSFSKSSKTTTTTSSSATPQSQRLTPSEAYALNLKKGRPPSIAQVLDKGIVAGSGSSASNKKSEGLMEESFGGRSRALLGLTGSSSGSKGLKAVNSATPGSGSEGKT